MADQALPPPKQKWYVLFANAIIDAVLMDLGATAAYASAIAAVPWLANPFCAPIVKWVINTIIGKFDERIKLLVDKGLLRVGGQIKKDKFDKDVEPLKQGEDVSDEQLQKIKDDADAIVHHGST